MIRHSTRAVAAAVITAGILTASCSKVFLQDDGFPEKLQAGCADEAACLRLEVEAQQRVVRCQPNTVGYVRCADAQADKLLADSFVARYADAKRERHEAAMREEQERRRAEADRMRAEATARQHQAEKARFVAELDREKRTVEACDASEPTREARRRRQAILENHPGDAVRKQCTPRHEMTSVTSECIDDHGFKRMCTKSVPGDIVGFTCPKSMDEELVQLGLYQLNLLDDYPYPDDRNSRRADQECERARERSKQLSERIEGLAQ